MDLQYYMIHILVLMQCSFLAAVTLYTFETDINEPFQTGFYHCSVHTII